MSDNKTFFKGTHRLRSPVETLDVLAAHLETMGITRIANVTGLDRIGIPVVLAVRPNARSLAVSQGKGADLDAARVSAVMESVELWHAEEVQISLRRSTRTTLLRDGHDAVDIDRLPRTSALPGDALDLFWVTARDVVSGASVWVPVESVSADFTLPLLPGSGHLAATSNGLASGNSFDEALVHGLCELIERDCHSLWHAQGPSHQAATGVDARSIDDSLCQELIQRFESAGVQVFIWDITSDIGVAAFCCLVLGDDSDWADPEIGAGCHPTREVALARALTEAAQARVTFIAGSRDDLGAQFYRSERRSERRRRLAELARAHRGERDFDRVPSHYLGTVSGDVNWITKCLARVGLNQILAVDLSRDAMHVSVLRAIVPGLEGPQDHLQCACRPGERIRALWRHRASRSGERAHWLQ